MPTEISYSALVLTLNGNPVTVFYKDVGKQHNRKEVFDKTISLVSVLCLPPKLGLTKFYSHFNNDGNLATPIVFTAKYKGSEGYGIYKLSSCVTLNSSK